MYRKAFSEEEYLMNLHLQLFSNLVHVQLMQEPPNSVDAPLVPDQKFPEDLKMGQPVKYHITIKLN